MSLPDISLPALRVKILLDLSKEHFNLCQLRSRLEVIFSLMQQILEKPLLPRNPFPVFDGPLRGHAEHLHVWTARKENFSRFSLPR
jgi:hypothetical protein